MSNEVIVEVSLLKARNAYNLENLKEQLDKYLNNLVEFKNILHISGDSEPELAQSVSVIYFDENLKSLPKERQFNYFFYYPYPRASEEETIDGDDDDEVCASSHWILPNKEFEGLYESLIYQNGLKEQILKFSESAIIFGKYNVNKNLVACNRIILLHGPPGTGKTSLCKAIVQKISIRLSPIYKFCHFVEINSHSLFSKWFSESGKLVSKLFTQIREMIDQPGCLVCVLIDEVESLAYDRCNLSNEPKDALRVVNAVLTQLDQLKNYPNVMIFATSNLMNTIDVAFVDRVDLKKFIGFPTERAIQKIYISALKDLVRVGLIDAKQNCEQIEYNEAVEIKINGETGEDPEIKIFKEVVRASVGLSGRILRKIPFLAHAFAEFPPNHMNKMSLEVFLKCMLKAVCDRNSRLA